MLRELERQILNKIQFADRYIDAISELAKNGLTNYKLNSKDIVNSLKATPLNFEHKSSQYFADVEKSNYTFRLLFDIKGDSVLTYIYVLEDGEFVDNGLSHFGYLLKYFDIEGKVINQTFGVNNREEFLSYVDKMISIFNDFVDEFMISQQTERV